MILMSEMPAKLIKLDLKVDTAQAELVVTNGVWVSNSEISLWTFCVYFCPRSACLVNKQGSF